MTNPTSNYNFQMPTATDLVTDLPADFEVFGQAVDTRLKALQPGTTLGDLAYSSATANTNTRLGIGTNGQVLGVVAGVPAWTTDASGMTNPMTTTGDTIYSSSGSTPARLGIGSTGNVLTVAGGVPTWAAPAGGGKIAQVVSATITTATSTSSTSFVDATNFNLSITPTNASSKVLVMIMACMGGAYSGDNSGQWDLQLLRGATSILSPGRNNWYENGTSDSKVFRTTVPITYLDSPATTSATTYKLQIRNQFGGSVNVNNSSNTSTITLMEVLA